VVGVVALAAIVLIELAGCTTRSSRPPDGALRLGGDAGALCVPRSASGEYTYALDALRNTSSETIDVERVGLVKAAHASMVDSFVSPVVNNSLIGVQPGWPPLGVDRAAFDARRPVPTSIAAGQTVNLVIRLRATAPATVAAVEVTYERRGWAYRVRNTTAVSFRDSCH
jgi:hypothetical protein